MMNGFVLNLIFLMVLLGCAGPAPDPVRVYRYDDANLKCQEIVEEVNKLFVKIGVETEDDDRVMAQNVTAYITGQLFLLPMLAMDVSGSNQIEKVALRKRIQRLKELSNAQSC